MTRTLDLALPEPERRRAAALAGRWDDLLYVPGPGFASLIEPGVYASTFVIVGGPEGRQKVCAVIQDVLSDAAFTTTYLEEGGPERKILYEDAELGFCILAHVYKDAKESQPHDHGPSWAIYGQARGRTVMSDWALVEAATEDRPGKVRHLRSYTLEPGMAHVYHEGDLHAPRRDGPTRLIRVEGQNMDKVRRLRYERT